MTQPNIQINPIYVDLPTVAAIVCLSESNVQKLVREKAFPRQRQISGRRVGWLLREVNEWAEARPHSDLPPPANTGAKKKRAPTPAQPGSPDDQTAC